MVNKDRLYWTLQAGGWAFYGSVEIVFTVFASEGHGISAQRVIFLAIEAVLCLLLTHSYRYVINRWKWLSLSMSKLILRIVSGVAVMGLLMGFLRIPFAILLMGQGNNKINAGSIGGQSFYYAIIFFLWTTLYFIYNFFERYNNSLKLEASIKEIELSNLKAQLNPHFIFNALNSIRALVDENPSKSKLAINQLSNILRNSLATEKRGLTSFDDELRIVKDYLGLESIRFEERLKTEFDIDPESNQFLVPPLMIQTLVENGIKHGVSKLTEGGIIQMTTRVDNELLRIYIRNSGQFQVNGGKKKSGGLGLDNTRQRLNLIYGKGASFRISTENNNFVLTEIVIPHLY